MSPLDLAPAAAVAEPTAPFSVRLAQRRGIDREAMSKRERRAYARRTARELEWLRSARLKHGPGIVLLDLSEGGALLEADAPLRPGSRFTLALEGANGDADVALHVLRCHIAQLKGDVAIYRGACEFKQPLDFEQLFQHKANPQQTAFVGIDAALSLLLQRCLSATSTAPSSETLVALEPAEVVRVLESVRGRVLRDGFDAYRKGVADLLANVLPAMQRGARGSSVVEIVESRLRAAADRDPDGEQNRLVQTGTLLMELVRRMDDTARERKDAAPAGAAAVTPTSASVLIPTIATDAPKAAWQKIVVRYREGTMLKGFTQDFHPSRGHFSLWPSITATKTERTIVPLARLKAVFFVRDFEGNADYVENREAPASSAGRRIDVTFLDSEVLRGTTLGYSSSGPGFFVLPSDPNGNNMRVFVISGAVRHVRFP